MEPTITILPPADLFTTIASVSHEQVQATILDPWYNRGIGGQWSGYNDWLASAIRAACLVSPHVFVWDSPISLRFRYPAYRIPTI